MITNDKGGMINFFDRENAWTDASGTLHIRIKKKSDRWPFAEIFLNLSFGCGTYSVTLRDTSILEPAAVMSKFTFEERLGDQQYREMDAEVGRWSNAGNKNNAQYVIHPFYNKSEVTKRGWARRVFVSVSLRLVSPLISDCDGDR
jgi:hypothetical protein